MTLYRCYVCGGHSGRPCEDIREARRRSPYVRPEPVPARDGTQQWEECNDLINNRGCIKQVVNDGKLACPDSGLISGHYARFESMLA